MGYCMRQQSASFLIKRANRSAALAAVKALKDKAPPRWGWSWVREDFAQAPNLQAALAAWRWETEDNEDGDIVTINFTGEKLGDDFELWKAIAPFVEKDSYIEMVGEDSSMWRWSFDGTACNEKSPSIRWE